MTVLEVLTAATDYLTRQGVESPRLNAEHLLAHVLGKKNRIELYLEFERPLGESERAPLRNLVRQRGEGRPLQHLLGTIEFLGYTFASDSRALIPRSETEQLVELVLSMGEFRNALDVGTGSGVIALSLALKRPLASVTGCDISPDALALAGENAVRHNLAERVHLVESDLLTGIRGPIDILVANLPYIPAADIPGLSREVGHDPVLALDGGTDGLDVIRRLVACAPEVLATGGVLALEIGHDQSPAVCELLKSHNFRDISPRRDYQNIERFVIAKHG